MIKGISRRRFVAAAPAVAAAAFASWPAWATAYPERTITLVAPFAPGGIVDIVGRILAPSLSATLGQSIIVVNKAGAAGIIGDEFVARSKPDGYTLLVTGNAAIIMGAAIYENLPYNVANDFAPVGKVVTSQNMIVVRGNSPIKTIHDFLGFCKANPDKSTYASVAPVDWLIGSLFAQKTGLNFTRVPYKSTGDADLAVVSGQVLFALPPAAVVLHGGKSARRKSAGNCRAKSRSCFPGRADASGSGHLRHLNNQLDWLDGTREDARSGDRQAQQQRQSGPCPAEDEGAFFQSRSHASGRYSQRLQAGSRPRALIFGRRLQSRQEFL